MSKRSDRPQLTLRIQRWAWPRAHDRLLATDCTFTTSTCAIRAEDGAGGTIDVLIGPDEAWVMETMRPQPELIRDGAPAPWPATRLHRLQGKRAYDAASTRRSENRDGADLFAYLQPQPARNRDATVAEVDDRADDLLGRLMAEYASKGVARQ